MPVNKDDFTDLTPGDFAETLARDLAVDLVPDLRDLLTQFGLRPRRVQLLVTRWIGGSRGQGQEYIDSAMPIMPIPKVEGFGSVQYNPEATGTFEVGNVTVSKINAGYTEEQLRGYTEDGQPPAKDSKVYYEIEFLGQRGRSFKRRFHLVGAPEYELLGWKIQLERASEDRNRQGETQT